MAEAERPGRPRTARMGHRGPHRDLRRAHRRPPRAGGVDVDGQPTATSNGSGAAWPRRRRCTDGTPRTPSVSPTTSMPLVASDGIDEFLTYFANTSAPTPMKGRGAARGHGPPPLHRHARANGSSRSSMPTASTSPGSTPRVTWRSAAGPATCCSGSGGATPVPSTSSVTPRWQPGSRRRPAWSDALSRRSGSSTCRGGRSSPG